MSLPATKTKQEIAVDAVLRQAAQEGRELKDLPAMFAYLITDCEFGKEFISKLSTAYLISRLEDYPLICKEYAPTQTRHQHPPDTNGADLSDSAYGSDPPLERLRLGSPSLSEAEFTVNLPYENGDKDVIFGRVSSGTESYVHEDVAERHMNQWDRRRNEGEVQVKVRWLIETAEGCRNREEDTWCTVKSVAIDEPNITFGTDSRDSNIRNMAAPAASGSDANKRVGGGPQGDKIRVIDDEDAKSYAKLIVEIVKQTKSDNKKRPSSEGENALTKRPRTIMEDLPNG